MSLSSMHSITREVLIARILHVGMRLTFRRSSNARFERKLNLLISEVRAGKREGSIISEQIFDAKAQSDQETWDILRRELEDIGISAEVIVEKRDFLVGWFQEAVAAGRLEEDISSASEGDSIIEGDIPGTSAELLDDESSTMSVARQEAQEVRSFHSISTFSPSQTRDVEMTSAENEHLSISDPNANFTEQNVQHQTSITLGPSHNPPVDFNDSSIRNSRSCHDSEIGNEVEQTSIPSVGADDPKLESSTPKDRLRPVPLALLHWSQRTGNARASISSTVRKSEDEDATLVDDAGAVDKSLLQYFLAKGADPVGIDTCDKTALDHATNWGKSDTTGILLDRRMGPFIIARCSRKTAPDKYAVVAVFVLDCASDTGISNCQKAPAIMFAAAYSALTIASALLRHDAIADPVAKGEGWSALSLAAPVGNDSIVRLLVKYGANFNSKFSDAAKKTHYTALLLAALGGGKSAVPLLMNVSEFGDSPSAYSWFAADSKFKLGILCKLRVEANRLTGKKGETPLMRAAKCWDVPAVRSLLRLSVNAKAISHLGETALVLLMKRAARDSSNELRLANSITIMGLLIDAGASLNEADLSGETVWEIAQSVYTSTPCAHLAANYQGLMRTVKFSRTRSSMYPLMTLRIAW